MTSVFMLMFKKNITFYKEGLPPQTNALHLRSLVWVSLAMIVIILAHWLPVSVLEDWYYLKIFPLFRVVYDYTMGWSPVPMVYVVVILILIRMVRWFKQMNRGTWYQISRAIGGTAALVFFFYLLWGFNYGQIAFYQRLGLQSLSMTEIEKEAEFNRATIALLDAAIQLPESMHTPEALAGRRISDNDLRADVKSALSALQLPHAGRVRVRQLWPNGFLMRWSTAGIYIPQTGEGHIDRGLLSVQKPYTIAHEMAHGYGVTDEGACNFIAWLACSQSENPWIRFGGAMSYWRSVASAMPDTAIAQTLVTLPPVVHQAIALVRENNAKYPDFLPEIRNAIYSSYLKRHGVKSGLRSYSEVVVMVHHYLQKHSVSKPPE